jgi:hypothetical protein
MRNGKDDHVVRNATFFMLHICTKQFCYHLSWLALCWSVPFVGCFISRSDKLVSHGQVAGISLDPVTSCWLLARHRVVDHTPHECVSSRCEIQKHQMHGSGMCKRYSINNVSHICAKHSFIHEPIAWARLGAAIDHASGRSCRSQNLRWNESWHDVSFTMNSLK